MANLISQSIIDIINNKIVPNLHGEDFETVTLDNLVSFGKSMSELDANSLKDYTNTFITAIINTEFNVAEVELLKLPIFKDALKYGAITQSIYRNGVTNAEESHAFTLQNGSTYDLETYHGFDFNVKVNDVDTSFRLVYSIPNTLYASAFTNIAPLVAYIHECVANDMNEKANALLLVALQGFAVAHATNRVKLVTEFNDFANPETPYEWEDITANVDLLRSFMAFAKSTIINTRRGMIARSKKYNDGTVLASTPISRNNLLVLGQFDEMMKTYAYANTYHDDEVRLPAHDIIDFWQNSGSDVIPAFDDVSKIDVTYGSTTEEEVTTPTRYELDRVVAMAYDDRAISVMFAPNKVTNSYNGNGDFTTFYDYYTSRRNVETRANGVIFTLE